MTIAQQLGKGLQRSFTDPPAGWPNLKARGMGLPNVIHSPGQAWPLGVLFY